MYILSVHLFNACWIHPEWKLNESGQTWFEAIVDTQKKKESLPHIFLLSDGTIVDVDGWPRWDYYCMEKGHKRDRRGEDVDDRVFLSFCGWTPAVLGVGFTRPLCITGKIFILKYMLHIFPRCSQESFRFVVILYSSRLGRSFLSICKLIKSNRIHHHAQIDGLSLLCPIGKSSHRDSSPLSSALCLFPLFFFGSVRFLLEDLVPTSSSEEIGGIKGAQLLSCVHASLYLWNYELKYGTFYRTGGTKLFDLKGNQTRCKWQMDGLKGGFIGTTLLLLGMMPYRWIEIYKSKKVYKWHEIICC